MPINRVILKT